MFVLSGCHGDELRRTEPRMKIRGEKMVKTGDRCVCVLRCDHLLDREGLFSVMTFDWLTPPAARALIGQHLACVTIGQLPCQQPKMGGAKKYVPSFRMSSVWTFCLSCVFRPTESDRR